MEAFPSIFWLIFMSWIVNTNDRTPQPMGRMAASQTPCTTSYMVTPPAPPSIWSKLAESTPLVPIDLSTFTWLLKIQLHVSLRIPHSHELMSSAIDANAGSGATMVSERTAAVTANASANRSSANVFLIFSMFYPWTSNDPFANTTLSTVAAVSSQVNVAVVRPPGMSR